MAGSILPHMVPRALAEQLDTGVASASADASRAEAHFAGELGRRIRRLRERRLLSRKSLAREANVSERYLA